MVEVSSSDAVRLARERYPRGLEQPEGGYRFSMDALLLACFARPFSREPVLDLGAGCGVAGLGLLLRFPERGLHVTAVEPEEAMVRACAENAGKLGFADVFECRRLDAASAARELPPQSCGLAVSNPPYRREHSGRTCREPARTRARFEGGGGIEDFIQGGARLLRQGGRFAMVHLSERLTELLGKLSAAGLEPKRIRFAHSKAGESSRLVLVESVRGGKPGVVVEPPLVLYEGEGQGTSMTGEALAFCPFLRCNP